jgi:thioredoxin-like negative regulator of GroEL
MSSYFEQYSQTYTSVTFAKVDIEAAEDIAEAYNVSSIPMFVLISKKNVIDQV